MNLLLFPVIAWYDIIKTHDEVVAEKLLFPVIAWYDIIYIYLYIILMFVVVPSYRLV